MRILALLLFIVALCSSVPLSAHDGHDHDNAYQDPVISVESALSVARQASAQMSQKDTGAAFGQLNKSWARIPIKNLALHQKGSGYYIISVLNMSEKKTLYVLMSDVGEIYDANFTGVFKGIE